MKRVDGNDVTIESTTDMTYESGWSAYSTGESQPRATKRNGVVHLNGMVKPSSDVTASTNSVRMFRLPEGFRPVHDMAVVQHGSSADKFRLCVGPDGYVSISRNNRPTDSTAYSVIYAGAWIHIHCAFLAGGGS